jgi:probable HAF family extracellular repeat protein
MDARTILRPLLFVSVVSMGACWSPIPAADASEIETPPYHLTRLGPLRASGLNNLGQVIGTGPTANNAGWNSFAAIYHSYGKRAGTVEAILGPESAGTGGMALNDRGQAVIENSNTRFDPNAAHTLFWDGVEARGIKPQGQQQNPFDRFYGRIINNSGTIAGRSYVDGDFQTNLWSDGQLRPIADSRQLRYGWLSAINDRGQVVGHASGLGSDPRAPWTRTHAVLWEDGQEIDLGTFGGEYANASDINNAGQVVGQAQDAEGNIHAFLWQDGTMTALGGPGVRGTYARAINASGAILGNGLNDDGDYVWFLSSDGSFQLLDDLLPPEFDFKWVQYNDINDLGQILGHGYDELLGHQSFLLTPGSMDAPAPVGSIPTVIPEPTTVVTLGVLGLVLVVHRRRARPSAR